jgi:hypothetical protein
MRTTVALWAATAAVAVANAVLSLMIWDDLVASDAYANLVGGSVASLVYASLGVIIVRRVGNRIGWLLLGVGLLLAVVCVTSAYAVQGLVTSPGSLPWPR